MSPTTAPKTIEALRVLFAKYGLPEQIVSDNGPQFVLEEFAHFMLSNGAKHIRSAPYHPSSNGFAERFVQTFKRAMKAGGKDGRTVSTRLSNFLLGYRSTPHATTNVSPGELFLLRKLRTRFDLLKPDIQSVVNGKQSDQKKYHDQHSKLRQFSSGQSVMIKDFRFKNKWIPGVVVTSSGPVSYNVELEYGKVIKRHVDHLRDHSVTPRHSPSPRFSPEGLPHDFEFFNDELSVTPLPTSRPEPPPNDSGRQYLQREHRPPDRFVNFNILTGEEMW